jgi:hypothetical protein
MSRQIKLIWISVVLLPQNAEHEIPTKRIHRWKKLPLNITGFEIQGEMQAIAFMVVTDET